MKAINMRLGSIARALLIVIVIFNAFVSVDAKAAPPSGQTNRNQLRQRLGARMSPDLFSSLLPEKITASEPPQDLFLETLPPPITLTLKATPESIEEDKDKEVTITWNISGIESGEIRGHSLSLQLPDGFTPNKIQKTDFTYEENVITISLDAIKGYLILEANEIPTEDIYISATLLDSYRQTLAVSDLVLPFRKEFNMPSRGGEISAEGGALKVEFSRNVMKDYPRGFEIKIGTPADMEAIQSSFSGHPFEIQAQNIVSKARVENFDDLVEFKINLADYGYSDVKTNDVLLYWYNPDIQEWEGMVSWVDEKTNTLYSETSHFSIFDVGPNNWEASKVPSVNAFQTSGFTGAATYSMPVEVPKGPGGLQPSLSLSYNSQVIDQATTWSQAGWVGMGWSLDTGYIELNTHNDSDPAGDSYFLHVNGISTEIISTANGYRTSDESFMKISYSGGNWIIWDKQGNKYEFTHKTMLSYSSGRVCDSNGENSLGQYTTKWSLTRVTNAFGNQLDYTYENETKQIRYYVYSDTHHECRPYGMANTDTATYPLTITYGGVRVQFDRQGRPDYNSGYANDDLHHSFERTRLDKIIILQDTDGNGSYEKTVRKYDLDYSNSAIWPNAINFSALTSVTEYGVDGTIALPPTTFAYSDGADSQVDHMHLIKATNGYGGEITFTYEAWYDTRARESYKKAWTSTEDDPPVRIGPNGFAQLRQSGGNPVKPGSAYYLYANTAGTVPLSLRLRTTNGLIINIPGALNPSGIRFLPTTSSNDVQAQANSVYGECEKNCGGQTATIVASEYSALTTIYRVTSKTITDGNGHSYINSYTYEGSAVNDNAHSAGAQSNNSYTEKYSEFRGHATVTETLPDGTQVITNYHQDDIYRGRISNTYTAVNGKKRVETINKYSNTELPGFVGYKTIRRYWVKQDSVENRVYDNNGINYSATKSLDTYEGVYGNVINSKLQSSWDGENWQDFRRSETRYWFTNTSTKYLVSLPGETTVFDGAGNILAKTLFLYDGNTGSFEVAPANGLLTSVRTLVNENNEFSQISYGYDAWGNQVTVTTYSGYGNSTSSPTSGARAATTVYDPIFHTYPISQTTPPPAGGQAGLTTEWKYDFDLNGVNDFILGLPTSQIDPNGNPTSVQYDAFGRPIKLIRPGDSTNSPTLTISYQDSFPFTTVITQKINADYSYYVQRVYDGMGRPTKLVSGGSIVDTMYDSPTETRQSMPYFTGDLDVFYTTTSVNPTDNITEITGPDGSMVTSTINGLETSVEDSGGNPTKTTKDVWGRVVHIDPPDGPSVVYEYDELDRLVKTTRGDGDSEVEIEYDFAGRKIHMDDPDMGNWWYEYDALGNLTEQVDAIGQLTCLDYDNLNRLIGKTYLTSGSCSTPMVFDVSYHYGTTQGELGYRTGMDDDSGSTTWAYDERGRVESEVKTISGQSFTTGWDYNSADLPITMTYPDGEILSYDYSPRMLLTSITSSLGETTYVDSSTYDASGRMTDRTLGNGLDQSFVYYDWTEKFTIENEQVGQGGRLKSIYTSLGVEDILQDLDYVYDASGNVHTITDVLAGPQTQTFTYDSLNRILTASASGGTDGIYSESYEYDPVTGNLSEKDGQSYSYLDPDHIHAVTNVGGNSYTYDDNGNMDARNVDGFVFDLAYDAENRLTDVTQGSQSYMPLPPLRGFSANPIRSGAFMAMPYLQGSETETPTSSPSPTATPQTFTLTLQPNGTSGADNTIVANIPTTNLGADSSLGTGERNDGSGGVARSLIKFDLSSLPANAVITSASLSLWISQDISDNDSTVNVYRLKTPFSESSSSWNLSSTGTNWQTAGASGENDRENAAIGSVVIPANETVGTEKQISLDPAKMQEYLSGTFVNNGFVLAASAELNDRFMYRSSDYGTAAQRPKLVIQYTLSDITPTPNFTETPTTTPTLLSLTDTPTLTPTPTVPSTSTATPQIFNFTLQPDGASGLDTYILSGSASSNFGTTGTLGVGERNTLTNSYARSLIKFDLSSLPSNAVVTSATLSVWTQNDYSDNDRNLQVFRLKKPFTETEATWNLAATGSSWEAAGASGASDREAAPIGSALIPANESLNTEKQIALDPAMLQEMADGTFVNNGLLLQMETELNDRFDFKSSDSGPATQRPKLVIQYTLSDATPEPTFTPTITATATTVTPTRTATVSPTVTFTETSSQPPVTVFASASFTYDGDGKRVRSVITTNISSTTTYFVGAHYELTGTTVTKYYYAGTQRIAMRKAGELYYLLGDHLGSTSLVTDSAGTVVSETRYTAWGEVRYTSGTEMTKYQYTGQYSYTADFGLMFYNARWYDPSLGRFAQADTIVPGGVQGLDRYAYTNNNPILYTDPSGHGVDCGFGMGCVKDPPKSTGGGNPFAISQEEIDEVSQAQDGYSYWLQLGIDSVNQLRLMNGWWTPYLDSQNGMEVWKFLLKLAYTLEAYSIPGTHTSEFTQHMTDSFINKAGDFYEKYGTAGLYLFLGTREAFTDRASLGSDAPNWAQDTIEYRNTWEFGPGADSVPGELYLPRADDMYTTADDEMNKAWVMIVNYNGTDMYGTGAIDVGVDPPLSMVGKNVIWQLTVNGSINPWDKSSTSYTIYAIGK